jgi:hypothetical protein
MSVQSHISTSSLGSHRNLHARLSPHLTNVSIVRLDVGVRIAVEGAAVVREYSQTGKSLSAHHIISYHINTFKPRLDHVPIIKVTSPKLEVPWHTLVVRLVEESHPVVVTRLPALGFFRSLAGALRHGEPAECLKLEARVGVADMEVDGGASRSSGQSIEDDKAGDVPRRSLNEGVAGAVLWRRGGKGEGESAQ